MKCTDLILFWAHIMIIITWITNGIRMKLQMPMFFESLTVSFFFFFFVYCAIYLHHHCHVSLLLFLDLTCTGFPGPGDRHLITFNPMREFIHHDHSHVNVEFDHFKKIHNKNYEDHMEHKRRKEIFRQNLR